MAIISLILAISLIFSPITPGLYEFVNDTYSGSAKEITADIEISESGEVIGNLAMNMKLSKDIKEWDYKKDSAELSFKFNYFFDDFEMYCEKEEKIEGEMVCTSYNYKEFKNEELVSAEFKIQNGALYVNKDAVYYGITQDYDKNPEIVEKLKAIVDSQINGEYLQVAKFEDLEKEILEDEAYSYIYSYKDKDFSNLEKIASDLFEEIKNTIANIGIKDKLISYANNKVEIDLNPELVVDVFHQVIQYCNDNFTHLEGVIDDYANRIYEDETVNELLKQIVVVSNEADRVEEGATEIIVGNGEDIAKTEEPVETKEMTPEEIEEAIRKQYFDYITYVKDELRVGFSEMLEVLNAKESVCTKEVVTYADGEEFELESCTQTKQQIIDELGDSRLHIVAERVNDGLTNIDFDLFVGVEDDYDSASIKAKITIKDIENYDAKFYASETTVEEYQKIFNKEYNKLDPYKEIKISWYDYYPEEDNFAYVNLRRDTFYSNYEEKQFYNIDGRIYLPMRYICESFGETVEWDGANKKAYVVRGNNKIDMSGIIYDGTTYIKIRDFEKLGYTVTYEQSDWGENIATITKY